MNADELRQLDFAWLWKGRGKTTEVEGRILLELLDKVDRARVLELGAGNGRLTPFLRKGAETYLGADAVPEFLQELAQGQAPFSPGSLFAANAYHLPLPDKSISVCVLVRVFNFLDEPSRAMAEIRRVLVPGGTLILGVQVRPSVATLVDDLKAFLENLPSREPLTLGGGERVQVRMTNVPAWQYRTRELLKILSHEGFALREVRASGLEDYIVLRRLPGRFFLRLSALGQPLSLFPTLFLLLQSGKGEVPFRWDTPLKFVCPACRSALTRPPPDLPELRCAKCDYRAVITKDIPDLRWVVVENRSGKDRQASPSTT